MSYINPQAFDQSPLGQILTGIVTEGPALAGKILGQSAAAAGELASGFGGLLGDLGATLRSAGVNGPSVSGGHELAAQAVGQQIESPSLGQFGVSIGELGNLASQNFGGPGGGNAGRSI